MAQACLKAFPEVDCVIMTAAAGDSETLGSVSKTSLAGKIIALAEKNLGAT